MFLSKCAVFNSRKPKFIKKEEVIASLSNLGIKAPLSKIPLVGPLFRGSHKRCSVKKVFLEISQN